MERTHARSVLLTVLSLSIGCGVLAPLRPLPDARVDGDTGAGDGSGGTGADGGTDGDAGIEAGGDGDGGGTDNPDATGGRCDTSSRFGSPVLVYGLNRDPGNDHRVHLSADELTAYVSSGSPWWVSDILVATRASTAQPFGDQQPLPAMSGPNALNGPHAELAVSLTGDGLRLFVESMRSGVQRIYASTRATTDAPFGLLTQISFEGGSDADTDVYVLPSGIALYFVSFNGVVSTIRRAPLAGLTVGPPAPIIQGRVAWPVVSHDELVLYFSEGEAAERGNGKIRMMTRASAEMPFGEPVDVEELNTQAVDFPQWISPDGCRLYFGRNMSNGEFLYVAERVRD